MWVWKESELMKEPIDRVLKATYFNIPRTIIRGYDEKDEKAIEKINTIKQHVRSKDPETCYLIV